MKSGEGKGRRRVGVGIDTGGRYESRPSYRRLFSDLGRPASAPEAAEVLRRRVPDDVLPWLDDVLRRQDLATLKSLAPPGKEDEKVELDMLTAAEAWRREKDEDGDGGCGCGCGCGGGGGGDEDGDGDGDGDGAPRPRPPGPRRPR